MNNRTVIIFDELEPYATVNTGNNYFIRRIEELSEQFPGVVQTPIQSDERCEFVIPVRWLRVNPPLQLSEEERQRRRENYIRNVLRRPFKG